MRRISSAAVRSGRDPRNIHSGDRGEKPNPLPPSTTPFRPAPKLSGKTISRKPAKNSTPFTRGRFTWHYIGHLQRNKAKFAVRLFDLIHSVDSVKTGCRTEQAGRQKAVKSRDILIQVNISAEATKSGVDDAGAIDLAKDMIQFRNIRLLGLMTMPPFFNAPEKARPFFARLRDLRDEMAGSLNLTLPHLSMGMTGDFEVAIEQGATLVRVGTAIFGKRQ